MFLPMAGKKVLTQDGQSLALSSLRPGDTVTMRSATRVVDTAQARTSLQGIVAIGPDPDGDAMTAQLFPARMILVDVSPQARINGQPPSVASLMSIKDADQVQVVGILNKTFDEMIQTWTIDWIGPNRTPSSATSAQSVDQLIEHAYAIASPSVVFVVSNDMVRSLSATDSR
ncbi:MAG TPA: hypothetical protein VF898_00455 [Chloroflexota bacterium]